MDAKWIVELSGKSYPLYAGVLAEAHEKGLRSIETELIQAPTAANEQVAIVKARVVMEGWESGGSEERQRIERVFEDYGDASPRNTNARLSTALIRFASTRAKGRALRDAINCGMTLLEELPEPEAEVPTNGKARARAAVTAAETQTTASQVKPMGVSPPAPVCAVCQAPLKPGQVQVSTQKWGRPLCPAHQAAARETERKAAPA